MVCIIGQPRNSARTGLFRFDWLQPDTRCRDLTVCQRINVYVEYVAMKPNGYLIGGLLMAVAGSSFAQGSDEYGFSREEMCALTAQTAPDTDYTQAYDACMSGSTSAPIPQQPPQQYDDNPDAAQEPEPEPEPPAYGSQDVYDENNEQQDDYQEEVY